MMKLDIGKKINFKQQFRGLSKREFLLLVVLIIAIEGYLLYAYLIKPAYNVYMVSTQELIDKQNTLNGLIADYQRKGEMEEQIAQIEEQIEEIQLKFPPFLSQEEATLYVEDMSRNSGIEVSMIGYKNASEIPLKAIRAEEAEEQQDNATGFLPMFVDQILSVNFSGGFSGIYSFLKSIETSERKMSVNSLAINVDQYGDLTGIFNISFPSYWNDAVGQKPYIMKPEPSVSGKNSPFDQYSGYNAVLSNVPSVDGSGQAITPDFSIKVNSYLNNSAKIFMNNPYNAKSEARYDENNVTRANLVINGGNGKYTYQYNLGTFNKSSSNETDIKNGKIRIEVLVQARRSVDDKDRKSVV